jgi:fluoride exporter
VDAAVSSGLAWLLVAGVGGAGAVGRYGVDALVERATGGSLPLGTLAVNASGALALGVLAGRGVGGDALLVAGAGALGSYTTFSTWLFETHHLAEDGELRLAAGNLLLGLAAGLVAAGLGWIAGAAL